MSIEERIKELAEELGWIFEMVFGVRMTIHKGGGLSPVWKYEIGFNEVEASLTCFTIFEKGQDWRKKDKIPMDEVRRLNNGAYFSEIDQLANISASMLLADPSHLTKESFKFVLDEMMYLRQEIK